jgi:hypothetical protein
MQRLEVSGAVRQLKWRLGIKWIMEHIVTDRATVSLIL